MIANDDEGDEVTEEYLRLKIFKLLSPLLADKPIYLKNRHFAQGHPMDDVDRMLENMNALQSRIYISNECAVKNGINVVYDGGSLYDGWGAKNSFAVGPNYLGQNVVNKYLPFLNDAEFQDENQQGPRLVNRLINEQLIDLIPGILEN